MFIYDYVEEKFSSFFGADTILENYIVSSIDLFFSIVFLSVFVFFIISFSVFVNSLKGLEREEILDASVEKRYLVFLFFGLTIIGSFFLFIYGFSFYIKGIELKNLSIGFSLNIIGFLISIVFLLGDRLILVSKKIALYFSFSVLSNIKSKENVNKINERLCYLGSPLGKYRFLFSKESKSITGLEGNILVISESNSVSSQLCFSLSLESDVKTLFVGSGGVLDEEKFIDNCEEISLKKIIYEDLALNFHKKMLLTYSDYTDTEVDEKEVSILGEKIKSDSMRQVNVVFDSINASQKSEIKYFELLKETLFDNSQYKTRNILVPFTEVKRQSIHFLVQDNIFDHVILVKGNSFDRILSLYEPIGSKSLKRNDCIVFSKDLHLEESWNEDSFDF